MPTYASKTEVSSARTRAELETLLQKYGADQFAFGYADGQAARVQFRIGGRSIRLFLPMPDPNARRFTHHSRGARAPAARKEAYEQAVRQRWRALFLVVKAKLVAIEEGISTLDAEFLASLILPDGRTVGEEVLPTIELASATGRMPKMLPMLEEPQRALPAPPMIVVEEVNP